MLDSEVILEVEGALMVFNSKPSAHETNAKGCSLDHDSLRRFGLLVFSIILWTDGIDRDAHCHASSSIGVFLFWFRQGRFLCAERMGLHFDSVLFLAAPLRYCAFRDVAFRISKPQMTKG